MDVRIHLSSSLMAGCRLFTNITIAQSDVIVAFKAFKVIGMSCLFQKNEYDFNACNNVRDILYNTDVINSFAKLCIVLWIS